MRTKSAVFLAAVLACCAACSRKPETPAAGTPTPAPTPVKVAATPPPAAAKPRIFYVGDSSSDQLVGFGPTGAAAGGFTTVTDAQTPAFAVDPASNTLYVKSQSGSKIRTFDATTGAKKSLEFGTGGYALAVAGGKVYVSRGNSIEIFDAATGAPVTTGFTSPAGLQDVRHLIVRGDTLFVCDDKPDNSGDLVSDAYSLATGAPVPGFKPADFPGGVSGMALSGNRLFITNNDGHGNEAISELDATTGAVVNAKFFPVEYSPTGLVLLGNTLYFVDTYKHMIVAVDIPASASEKPTTTTIPLANAPKGIRGLDVAP